MTVTTKRFARWAQKTSSGGNAGICVRVFKNKAVESEVTFTRDFWDWFRICTQFNRKGNQPGFCFGIDLLWFRISFEAYDRRSWDHKKKRFIEVEESSDPFKYF